MGFFYFVKIIKPTASVFWPAKFTDRTQELADEGEDRRWFKIIFARFKIIFLLEESDDWLHLTIKL